LQSGQTVQIRQNANGVVTGLTIDTGNGQQVLFTRRSGNNKPPALCRRFAFQSPSFCGGVTLAVVFSAADYSATTLMITLANTSL
jgi:hypothetical protein